MEDNIFVTHHDTEGRHFTLSYDSARLDVYKNWRVEKGRFKAAHNLYLSIRTDPAHAAEMTQGFDTETTMYLPVLENFNSKSRFNYSRLLHEMAGLVDDSQWTFANVSDPVVKIISDRKSLRGNPIGSTLVDLLQVYYEPASFSAIYRRLDESFSYIPQDTRTKMVTSIYDILNPRPKSAPVLTSPIDENRRLLKQQRDEMLRQLRAANRW